MKGSIGKKLTTSGLVVLLFIILIFIASQVAVSMFKETSKNLITEYNELDALQEFKLSLGSLMISTNYFASHREEQYKSQFCDEILNTKSKLGDCFLVITRRHDRELLSDLRSAVAKIDSLTVEMLKYSDPENAGIQAMLNGVKDEIEYGTGVVDVLLKQTKLEIIKNESINHTVIKHSTYTFLTLGIMVIAILIFRGMIVIRSVTRPIRQLVSITDEISKGNKNARANIHTKDEFSILAQSFNNMINALENTTVSRNYLNNILENMFEALIVTDNGLRIRSANKAALELLGYTESEMKGMRLPDLFEKIPEFSEQEHYTGEELAKLRSSIIKQKQFITKSGRINPASVSCSVLKSEKDGTEGLIIVGHDLTEQYAIENKLDHLRKERLIAINEAQEEERMRIATDLHDGLGQMLTAISYAIQEFGGESDNEEEIKPEVTASIQKQIDAAIREAKSIAHDLIPIVLKDFGLIVAIENLIRKANELYDTKFQFNAFDFNERIDPKLEKALYRICQESVNNIIKHARAKNAMFQILRQNQAIVLVIEDDGRGFDPEFKGKDTNNAGIGLISMKERVIAFDGTFTINSSPDFGTEIIIEIPCRKS